MARKTDEEKLQELEQRIEQLKARKQQTEARLKEKERKERTRRLIQVGAIFEKYFDLKGIEEAEQIALSYQSDIKQNKEKIQLVDVEKSRENNTLVYKEPVERMIAPKDREESYQ